MRIVFGWNRIKLKSFSLQELNIETTEQTRTARVQVSQSYFHLFWIPFFPLGKRYSLIINNEDYHIPPAMWRAIDPEQIKAKGKWYAWSLPILAVVIGIGVYINGIVEARQIRESYASYLQEQRSFFDHPKKGDGMIFQFPGGNSFQGEVLEVSGKKVTMLVEQIYLQDRELKLTVMTASQRDTMNMMLQYRDRLEINSIYRDSLLQIHPNQPLLRKLKIYELEGFPVRAEVIEMPLAEYQNMDHSIGEYGNKPVKIKSFREKITPHALIIEPIREY